MTRLSDDERELVEEHLQLVPQVLARVAAHYPRHADREELAQAARLGLVEAAVRFDPTRGVPFGGWATLRIRGAILDAVRAHDVAPRSLRVAERETTAAREALSRELGRAPTAQELAARLGTTEEQVARLEGRVRTSVVLSLDAEYGHADGQPLTLGDGLVSQVPQPLEVLEDRERARYVGDALACLPDRLRDVLITSYVDGELLGDIAVRLGVTESRVSQMRAEALSLVREAINAQYGGKAPTPIGRSARRRAAYADQVRTRSSYATRLSSLPRQRQASHDSLSHAQAG